MIYLKGLHGLRFFAALLVLIFHANDGLYQLDKKMYSIKPIMQKGHVAVDFFFILSGFLLTYLACLEHNKHGNFDIKKFFLRRVYRIFPLYYLIVFIGFVSMAAIYPRVFGEPFYDFPVIKGFVYYLFFLPNWVIAQWENIGPTYPLWSIGVEEQFYLLFPVMIVLPLIKGKLHITLPLLLVGYTLFHVANASRYFDWSEEIYFFIDRTLRFHFILWGCLLGYLYHRYPLLKEKMFSKGILQLISLIALGYLLWIKSKPIDPHHLLVGIVFSILMISLTAKSSLLNLEYKPLVHLGVISYGIYVFHPFISLALRFLAMKNDTFMEIIKQYPWLFYLLLLIMTVIIAHLSYRYYESYFLELKKKYSR